MIISKASQGRANGDLVKDCNWLCHYFASGFHFVADPRRWSLKLWLRQTYEHEAFSNEVSSQGAQAKKDTRLWKAFGSQDCEQRQT